MVKRSIVIAISLVLFAIDQILQNLKSINLWSEKRSNYVVVYYHHVTAEERNRLKYQMELIKKWTVPISIDALSDDNKGENNSVLITFDDAFECVFENAYPILKIEKIPFSVFVPLNWIGGNAGWMNREEIDSPCYKVISKDDLKNLAKDPLITLASHGLSHRRLTELSDEESKNEIEDSKEKLEKIIGVPVKYMSFPHGVFNNRELHYAIEAGYTKVFTIMPEKEYLPSKKYVQGRVRIDPSDSALETILKIRGCYRWRRYISRIKNINKKMKI